MSNFSVRNHTRFSRALVAVLIPVALDGCALAECPPSDPSASVITTQTVAGAGVGLVQGYVIGLDQAAAGTARVRLREGDSIWSAIDPAGNFQLRAAGRGSYTLDVLADGYSGASQLVSMSPDSGVRVVATMVPLRTHRRDARCGIDSIGSNPP
ncbi:MAG: hypothetical protein V4617_18630 [Gemmatimonadota bacterium]